MPKRILIVDDDADVRELLRFNLRKAGYAVGTAGNGLEALKKVRSLAPDLVLLDVMMPEMDGLTVCEALRRDPSTATLRVVLITAWASQFARFAGIEAGADEFITKPFSPQQVIARIHDLLCRPLTA